VTPDGPVCNVCTDAVSKQLEEMMALAKKGELKAALDLGLSLQKKGVALPPGLLAALRGEEDETPAMTPRHASVTARFKEWDESNAGVIPEEDFKAILSALGLEEKLLSAIINDADLNKDGQISYEEFISWVFRPAPAELVEHFADTLASSPKSAPVGTSNLKTPFELMSSFWIAK